MIGSTSAIAVVHSRFSTNVLPRWDLAQPFRFIAHNGEINTVRGNRNWMTASETTLETDALPLPVSELTPIVTPDMSDSASFDEVVELLVHVGSLAAARGLDDDSRSLGALNGDESSAARLLSLPRGTDGTVGWSRVGDLL